MGGRERQGAHRLTGPPLPSDLRSAPPTDSAPGSVARRVVVLGASNVAQGLPHLLHALHGTHPGRLELFLAHGYGRSYGAWSRCLARALPGILQCGLWERLADAVRATPEVPLSAVVTDVGNDLLYGASVETIAGWVADCLDRLALHGADVVLAGPPLESVLALGERRYRFARRILFPRSAIPLDELRQQVRELDASLARLALERRIRHVRPIPDWYGFDPIHIRPGCRPSAWRLLVGPPRDEASANGAGPVPGAAPGLPPSPPRAIRRSAARVMHAERILWGRTRTVAQPCVSDESLVVHAY